MDDHRSGVPNFGRDLLDDAAPQHRAPLAPVMVATRLFGRFYRDEQLRTCPQREAVHPGKGAPEG